MNNLTPATVASPPRTVINQCPPEADIVGVDRGPCKKRLRFKVPSGFQSGLLLSRKKVRPQGHESWAKSPRVCNNPHGSGRPIQERGGKGKVWACPRPTFHWGDWREDRRRLPHSRKIKKKNGEKKRSFSGGGYFSSGEQFLSRPESRGGKKREERASSRETGT